MLTIVSYWMVTIHENYMLEKKASPTEIWTLTGKVWIRHVTMSFAKIQSGQEDAWGEEQFGSGTPGSATWKGEIIVVDGLHMIFSGVQI